MCRRPDSLSRRPNRHRKNRRCLRLRTKHRLDPHRRHRWPCPDQRPRGHRELRQGHRPPGLAQSEHQESASHPTRFRRPRAPGLALVPGRRSPARPHPGHWGYFRRRSQRRSLPYRHRSALMNFRKPQPTRRERQRRRCSLPFATIRKLRKISWGHDTPSGPTAPAHERRGVAVNRSEGRIGSRTVRTLSSSSDLCPLCALCEKQLARLPSCEPTRPAWPRS
jgi:hypothetical protein